MRWVNSVRSNKISFLITLFIHLTFLSWGNEWNSLTTYSQLIDAHIKSLNLNHVLEFSFHSKANSNNVDHIKFNIMLNGIEVENKYIIVHDPVLHEAYITDNLDGLNKHQFETILAKNTSVQPQEVFNKEKLLPWKGIYKLTDNGYKFYFVSDFIDNEYQVSREYFDPAKEQIEYSESLRCDIDSLGVADTHYMGTKPLVSNYAGSNNFLLENLTRNTSVKNCNHTTNINSSLQFSDSDNNWTDTSHHYYATDAFIATNLYHKMLDEKFNRSSIDGNGGDMQCYVNYSSNLENAFWNGQAVVFGSGSNSRQQMTTYDITGHEFTHGLIQHSAALIYKDESGALNEAISDIMGVALEHFNDPQNFNFLIAEETGTPLRSLESPSDYNQPIFYHGSTWYFGKGDHGGVHINSGVINRWFYLLVNGGNGVNEAGYDYSVQPIGFDPAITMVFNTLTGYMFPDDTFEKFRDHILAYCIDEHGVCSKEFKAAWNAFKAVGISSTEDITPSVTRVSGSSKNSKEIKVYLKGNDGFPYTWEINNSSTTSTRKGEKLFEFMGDERLVVSQNICGTVVSSKIMSGMEMAREANSNRYNRSLDKQFLTNYYADDKVLEIKMLDQGPSERYSIVITDLQGRIHYENPIYSEIMKIDLSTYKSGIYIASISTGKVLTSQKIIVFN